MLRMTSIALDTDMPASALGIFAPFRVKISAYLPRRLGESQRIHCKNKSATMTPFYGANSLCEIDTLFWCQT